MITHKMNSMKHIKLSLSILALGMVVLTASTSSCKKQLEVDAVGYVSQDSAIRNETDLLNLINSGYFAFADGNYYGGNYQVYSELLADHLDGSALGGDYQGVYTRNANIFNTGVSDLYAQMNKPVFQANSALDFINLASAANKNSIEGQAKFMRAMAQFDLVRLFAQPYKAATAASEPGIPLRLTSARKQYQRSSVAEVYAQIIADLKDAEAKLPPTNGVYATKWSAKALLAQVYFQMNDFPNAYLYSNDVLTNGGFPLDANYSKRISSTGTPEAMLQFVYETNNTQGRFQNLRNAFLSNGSALPALRLTQDFYTKATSVSSDNRKPWYHVVNGFYLLGKFDTASFKLPVLYTTQMKLIRAESAAETNTNLAQAITDMNDILRRAYGPTSPLLLSTGASAGLIKDAARRERELELVGEGNRVQELKRIGAKGETITIRGSVYNCPGMVLPFPTNEVNYNGFLQNPTGGCN